MKNYFTKDINILGKSLKLSFLMDLMNTWQLVWNLMINIQYLNIRIDEERSSVDESSAIRKYLLCELLSNRYILIQETVKRSIWFYAYVLHQQWQFSDELYQQMYQQICRFLFLLLGVHFLSIILSQSKVLQAKQSTLEKKILDISIKLFF